MENKIKYIWDEFYLKLYKYVNSKIEKEEDTEDILQDIFIKIYNNLDNLTDESKIKPWIYKITKNAVIDYYKKKKSIPTDISEFDKYTSEDDSSNNMNEDISKCLENLIFSLPEKYQKPIYLYDIKEKKHNEICEELEISLSCSKMRVLRARNLLRDLLFDCCEFEFDAFGNIVDYKSKNDSCSGCSNCGYFYK